MKPIRSLRCAITAVLLCGPGATALVHASGGDGFYENPYAPEMSVPAKALPAYAQGSLGVVPHGYWRVYLFLAYRAATGQALNKSELDALQIREWRIGSMSNREDDDPGLARDTWLAARQTVPGAVPLQLLEVEKYDETTYNGFVNCPADALRRAVLTLAERLKAGGPTWAGVWLGNQDAVFANCSLRTSLRGGQPAPASPMPAPLPPKAPAWLKQDHAYQTAAALFYAGQFDAARARFQEIGKDKASPWQPWGDYLAARCLIRKATLAADPGRESGAADATQAESQKRIALLETARTELSHAAKGFAPARQLLGWVDARVRPRQRLDELARELAVGRFHAESPALLSDYLLVLDRLEGDMLKAGEPMTRWIGAMQAAGSPALRKQALALSRSQWASSRRDPLWLVPLLSLARAGELSPEESKAAAAVPPTSPVYVHLQYQLARIAVVQNRADEADARVSALLQATAPALSVPTRNRLLGLKMLSDGSREGYFKAAGRTVADSDPAVPITDEGAASVPGQSPAGTRRPTDADYASHLYRQFSLAELNNARSLAKDLVTDDLAGAIWTRAVILGDFAMADAYTDELMTGRHTTQHLFRRYAEARGTQAKRDAAMLILVNVPELTPHLMRPSSGSSNNGWDCGPAAAADAASAPDDTPQPLTDELDAVWPRFLGTTAREQVGREMKTLLALPKRSDYLGPGLLDWAQRQPQDPEVPKALHFFVASTRMECPVYGTAASTPRKSHSQQAFELLHKRYPRSEWAAKTKYHF